MITPEHHKTFQHLRAEGQVVGALYLLAQARRELTEADFTEFVRKYVNVLGGHGFVSHIGRMITDATTINSNESG